MKNDFGYWKNNISIDEYKNRINQNLIKKYNSYMDESLHDDFELIKT